MWHGNKRMILYLSPDACQRIVSLVICRQASQPNIETRLACPTMQRGASHWQDTARKRGFFVVIADAGRDGKFAIKGGLTMLTYGCHSLTAPKCLAFFLCLSSDSFELKTILHSLQTKSELFLLLLF
jgi:hypothetical protein